MTAPQPLILVTNCAFPETLERLSAFGSVDANLDRTSWARSEILRRAAEADAILAFMPDRVDSAFLRQCRRLRVVACALKGFDNFDISACTDSGVWVTVVPDLLTDPMAELAVGLAIALGRMIRDGDLLVRSGAFEGWRPILYGTGLDGSTVCIIGMGLVGCAIARRLSGFGCHIFGVDPRAEMPLGVTSRDLAGALADSDFVIVAAPLNRATYHLIGRDTIAGMKSGALMVNVGRGSVVDETAVVEALESGALGGYAADVFEMEDGGLPRRPPAIDPRLRQHSRTLFTPHLGSAVTRVRRAIELRAADNIADVLAGKRPRDAINQPVLRDGRRRSAG
jgi:phosphonate dehydrogenase